MPPPPPLPARPILFAFAVTRLGLVLVGVLALTFLPIDVRQRAGNYRVHRQLPKPLEMWVRWDAEWYLAIAEHGYRGPLDAGYDLRPALFPLYPLLVAAVNLLLRSPVVAGLIVANLALLLFLFALWRLVELDFGAAAAGRAVWLYLLFPSSLFLSGIYTESVMLAASVGAALAARRSRWAWAGMLAALAALSRPVGGLILILLAVEYLASCDYRLRRVRVGELCWLLLPSALALGAYGAFAARTLGDPLALLRAQEAFRGATGWPWQSFARFWAEGPKPHGFANSMFDAALALLALGSLPAVFKRLRPSYGCYAAASVIVPLMTSLASFSRLSLAAFPCFILLAVTVERGLYLRALLALCAVLLGICTAAFARWQWVA